MAKPQTWTDEWIRGLEHPPRGKPERLYPDPTINSHRLVVSRTAKRFEIQRERPKQFGGRKTWKVQTGDALNTTVEQARTRALRVIDLIKQGLDPNDAALDNNEHVVTLGQAWERFQKREGIKESTLKAYRSQWNRNLAEWSTVSLRTLVGNPMLMEQKHAEIKVKYPVDANRCAQLVRTLYRDAAQANPSLPRDRTPVDGLGDRRQGGRWSKESPKDGHIPTALLPAWKAQLEKVREATRMPSSEKCSL
jgi:hypothetical protein